MAVKRRIDTYESLFVRFSVRIERYLLVTAAALAVLLVLFQCLLQIGVVRHTITTVDVLEGTPIEVPASSARTENAS